MDIDRQVKKTVILGLNGSGKTYFAKTQFLEKEKYALVIDPNMEYDEYVRYVPKISEKKDQVNAEIDYMLKRLVFPNAPMQESKKKVKNPLRLLVVDEADLFCSSSGGLSYSWHRLLIECRHRNLNLVFISRRPTDLNAKIMDLADEIIIFCQTGANARKRLDSIAEGLGAAAAELNYQKHEYLLVNRQRKYTKCVSS